MLELFKILNVVCGIIVWIIVIYGIIDIMIVPMFKKLLSKIKGTIYHSIELKIYLDDERACPKGWVLVRDYQSCIEILQVFNPSHLSLDHDLGEDKTGYDIVKWIEEKAFNDPKYMPPILTVHSANPAGRKNIELAITSIDKIVKSR